ncbi:MAG: D-glycero-beta-D-manno-heptose 1,7-bisphosphate 7-phosphatase [Gammaproteobacteria bacterium]|nr:D-glycero-beta-D-manno-heptose 1,7-bisphosphate 7-phosphatase [Gammaproteobacteria bacterium]NIR98081.1 D-glycero-beta-D-manno-heptose 1,7-bisphosphate 7-phosphatase [Gammaproteobacteria bacterium]NIT63419.1 D-glycero-beta-D-manno-heptose 1,7-bisphosphate 7-phosphatase [Gammaproteobacteria bacterium]NIV20326.1 D-glycero-beta-D-manno-heptose 1,7-bisphosphate 7-phosphatase [Gammaproteobacteria bacterium]NIX10803.1 D-glycero-beta-D-manno-heptose 1,7-bisphosphate 7-phosphatase [Gammaproteobacter
MKLVILDRDGVINEDSDDYIKSPEEWVPIPGSLEAIARLNQSGYRVVVASNQSGLARGLFDIEALNRIHDKMHRALAEAGGTLEAIFFCPHGPDEGCKCRKPEPGLLEEIAKRLRLNLSGVPAVGDTLRDLEAARAAGARPILVRTGKGTRTLAAGEGLEGVAVYADLAAVADRLVGEDSAADSDRAGGV